MSNFHEAVGQHVHKEPTNEFMSLKGAGVTVFGGEGHGLVVDIDEPLVADSDGSHVAPKVPNNSARRAGAGASQNVIQLVLSRSESHCPNRSGHANSAVSP